MERKYILMLAIVAISLALSSSVFLTTIDNTNDPTFDMKFYDSLSQEILDIENATLSGTIHVRATVKNVPEPAIAHVTLFLYEQLYGGVKGSYFGFFVFTTTSDQALYDLYWDTTTIPNGHYILEFCYIQEVYNPEEPTEPIIPRSDDPIYRMEFSSLYFTMTDSEALPLDPITEPVYTTTTATNTETPILIEGSSIPLISLSAAVVLILVIILLRRR